MYYVFRHRDQLASLKSLSFGNIIVMLLLCLIQMAIVTVAIQRILISLGFHVKYFEMLMLQNSTLLLNYVPMQFGTLFRAAYLKRCYGLGYATFASFFLYLTVMMLFCSAIAGECVLLFVYGLEPFANQITCFILAVIALLTSVFLFMPLPLPKAQNRWVVWIRHFMAGREQIKEHRSTFLICAASLLASFCIVAARLWLLYSSLGQKVNPLGFILLGSIAYIAVFVSVTPGGLGIRELILAAGAVVIAVPFEIGSYAILIDRAVLLCFAFFAGGGSLLVLWKQAHLDKQFFSSTKEKAS